MVSKDEVIAALNSVKDPEIDTISIIELGMAEEVVISPEGFVTVKLLPTFMGCPALEIIKKNVRLAVGCLPGVLGVEAVFAFHPPWTSDRVTDTGRQRLKEFGIAPPPRLISESGEWQADCPYCGSTYTTMENLFGPTACRSILYCRGCKNPFEAMKPVSTLM
ncbi:1,2-phenylacetyl-CoA epoxidase subunit PaaD [Peribacillus sp. SCS-37]|uniref:1,2-phenylacetyl-CoA epoxidase subunit PaaD n=1 Tax=Paraperibacillus esterisolvens TaxID=3115296 RepID=UPI003905E49A